MDKGKTDACLLRSEKGCIHHIGSGGQQVYSRGKDVEHECTREQVSTEKTKTYQWEISFYLFMISKKTMYLGDFLSQKKRNKYFKQEM